MKPITLREYAINAFKQKKSQEEKEKKDREMMIADIIGEDICFLIQQLPPPHNTTEVQRDDSDPKWPVVYIVEDLRFTGVENKVDEITNNYLPALIGTCPQCEKEAAGKPIRELADLGEALETFEPDSSHKCTTES